MFRREFITFMFDRMRPVVLIILHRVSLFSDVCAWLPRELLDCPCPFHYTEADVRRTNEKNHIISLQIYSKPDRQTENQRSFALFDLNHASCVQYLLC